MAQMRLGTIGLAAKDIAYIRALLRLYSHTAKLEWVFVDQSPYQAVVTDRAARAADPAWFAQFPGPVLTLVAPPGNPEADTVAYPVHAEQLQVWLTLRQQALLAAPAPVQPVAPPAAVAPPAVVPTAVVPPAVVPPAVAPAAVAPSAAMPAPDETGPASGERRYKLRRWPSTALLQGNELHLKVATLLSRADLSTARLAALTGQAEHDVRRFLIALHQAGLLVESEAAGSTPGHTKAPAAPAAAAPVRTGLLASLRRHLGL